METKILPETPAPSPGNSDGALFLYFFLLNFVLSYVPFPWEIKSWLFLFGVLIPFVLAAWTRKKSAEIGPPVLQGAVLPSLSIGMVVLLGAFSLVLRFVRLSTLSKWPALDEAMFGHFGMDLAREGKLHFVYGIGQVPPLMIWALGLAFKVFGVSLFTLWGVPSFFSALTVPLVFLASRKFLDRALAGLMAWFWAFSFWPLYEGRFCVQYPLFMFWMWLSLYLLGIFFEAGPGPSRDKKAVLLGLALGAGFYISPGWVLVALAAAASVLFHPAGKRSRFYLILLPVFLLVLPWVVLAFQRQYGSYVANLWAFRPGLSPEDQLSNFSRYVLGLFCGMPAGYSTSSYGPHWGGLLNPVLGAFFLLGLLRLWRFRSFFWSKFFLCVALVFLAPAFLTKDLEYFRVFQLLPLLLAGAALGVQSLAEKIPPPRRHAVLTALLFTSLAMDVYHLYGAFPAGAMSPNAWLYKSYYRYQAGQVLEDAHRRMGPGFVFDQFPGLMDDPFPPRYSDPSLTLATYPYNASVNPGIGGKDARWAGILCDSAFRPYLEKIFPSAVWPPLSDRPVFHEYLILGLIPLQSQGSPFLEKWLQADKAFRKTATSVLSHVNGQPFEPVLRNLEEVYPSVQGDPFLEACWWLKYSGVYSADGGRSLPDEKFLRGIEPPVASFGFLSRPLGKLYQSLGVAYVKRGRFSEAKEAFTKAASYHPDFKVPPGVLERLDQLEKRQKPAPGKG